MTLQVRQIHHSKLEHFLKGGITGGVAVTNPVARFFVHGLTLVFNNPVGLVGFVAAGGPSDFLTPKEVKTQIEAAVAVTVTFHQGRLCLIESGPLGGVDLSAAGTANQILGFGTTTDTVGTFYNPPGGGAPELVAIGQVGDGFLQVVTDE